jgi:carboxyl-terminal processing protease
MSYSAPGNAPMTSAAPSSSRPYLFVVGALLLALVFVIGLIVGQSGLLGGPPTAVGPTTGVTPTGSPTAPGTPAGPTPTLPPGAPADFALFWEAYQIIRDKFVGRGELAETDITYGAIRGMVEALGDTGHSVFLTPEALQREEDSLSGTIVGIGVLLGERDGQPVIVSVVSGGPASRAGLRSGDEIHEVDGTAVHDLAPEELAPLIRGDEGTTVEITVLRPSTNETLTVQIVREQINFPAASWTMVPGTQIALLRLIQFSDGAADQLRAARDEAIAAGARGLILDLRSNPGGFVHEAVRTAGLFLDRETVYIREQSDGARIEVPTCRPAGADGLPDFCRPVDAEPATDLPLVVLIDEGTASSAEIVSGALAAAQRGELVGDTTFGTGTVLLTYELADGSAVRIAVERWLTPDGELIFDRGIEPTIPLLLEPTARPLEPDEVAALDPAGLLTSGDVQLLRAIDVLHTAGVP